MTVWEVDLLGHDLDLEKVASLSQPPTWSVRKRAEDSRYILQSDAFAGLADAETVQNHARDNLLPVLNGVLSLEFPSSQMDRVHIGREVKSQDEQGVRSGYLFVEMHAVISVSEESTVTDGAGNTVAPTTHSPSMAKMCTALQHDEDVRNALYHFTAPGQWTVNLYKVVEIIHHDLGVDTVHKLVGLGWATQHEANDFTSAVHNPAVTGRLARHAASTRPPSANPMDEDRARVFVQGLLHRWIYEKYQQLGVSPSST